MKVSWMSGTLELLGDLQGTSPGRRVPAGIQLEDIEIFCPPEIYFNREVLKNFELKNQTIKIVEIHKDFEF